MKKVILLVTCLMLISSVSAAKTFTGYAGYVKEAVESENANFITNWDAGEIPLNGGSSSVDRMSLSKTVTKDTPASFDHSKRMYLSMVEERRSSQQAECTEGEYQLTDYSKGKYFGAEKCVNGAWVEV